MSKQILSIFAVFALLVAGPIACKKGDSDAESSSAAAEDNSIVGTWEIDIESLMEEVPEEEREMARAMMGMMGNLSMVFGEDETLTIVMGEDNQQSGTYDVTSRDGDTLSMTLTSDEGDASDVTVTFLSADQVRIDPVDEEANGPQTMILNRAE